MEAEIAKVHVRVAVAVSETGMVRVHALEGHLAEFNWEYKKFRDTLVNDHLMWSLKIVKVSVPMPLQYEDTDKQEAKDGKQ